MKVAFGPGCPWYWMVERFGAPNVDWCESAVCAWVNEPANAWSNLAYILPALWFWKKALDEKMPQATLLACAAFFMGFFSFTYHATNNLLTQYFDFLGMYLWVIYLIVLRLRAAYGLAKGAGVYWALIAALMGLTHVLHALNLPFQAVVAALAFILLGTEFAWRKKGLGGDGRLIAGAATAFFMGALCSAADVSRYFCIPNHPFLQGHALWHCFGGVGMTLMLVYHRRLAR